MVQLPVFWEGPYSGFHHSPDDEMMPFSHGEQLFERAKEPKQILVITGTHNEGFITSGKHYEQGLDAFISEHLHSIRQ